MVGVGECAAIKRRRRESRLGELNGDLHGRGLHLAGNEAAVGVEDADQGLLAQ